MYCIVGQNVSKGAKEFLGTKTNNQIINRIQGLISVKTAIAKDMNKGTDEEQKTMEQRIFGFNQNSIFDYLQNRLHLSRKQINKKITTEDGLIDLKKLSDRQLNYLKDVIQEDVEQVVMSVKEPEYYIKKKLNTEAMKEVMVAMKLAAKETSPFYFNLKWSTAYIWSIVNNEQFFKRHRQMGIINNEEIKLDNLLRAGKSNFKNKVERFRKRIIRDAKKIDGLGSDVDKYFPYLNEYRPYSVDPNNEKIIALKSKMKEDNFTGDVDKAVEFLVHEVKPQWDKINYGNEYTKQIQIFTGTQGFREKFSSPRPGGDPDEKDGNFLRADKIEGENESPLDRVRNSVTGNSYIGFLRSSLSLYNRIQSHRKEASQKKGDNLYIREIEKKMAARSDWKGFTLGYVPGRSESSIMPDEVRSNKPFSKLFPNDIGNFLKSIKGNKTGDMFAGFETHLREFTGKLGILGELSGTMAKEQIRRSDSGWRRLNPAANDVMKHYFEKTYEALTKKRKMTTAAKIAKNLLSPVAAVSASSVLFASGLPNLGYGVLGLHLKFKGYGKVRNEFNRERGNEGSIAYYLDKGNYREMGQDLGMGVSYLNKASSISADEKNKLVKASAWINQAGNVLGNKMLQKGPFGLIGEITGGGLFQDKDGLGWLSFTKTERKVREPFLHYVYQDIKAEIEAKRLNGEYDKEGGKEGRTPKGDELKAEVDRLFHEKYARNHGRILEAVGAFDKRNKAFWSHFYLETADTLPKVMLGWSISTAYMFQKVGLHMMNLVKDSYHGSKRLFSKEQGNMTSNKSISVGGFVAGLFLAGYSLMSELFSEDLPRINAISNANPLQVYESKAMTLYHTVLAPMLNLPISEGAAKYYKKEMIRSAGGFMAGNTLADIFEGKLPGEDVAKKIIGGELSMANYEKRRDTIRTLLDNPFPAINFSNDVLKTLRLANKVTGLFSEEDVDYGDVAASLGRNIFSMSIYQHPKTWETYKDADFYKVQRMVQRFKNTEADLPDYMKHVINQVDKYHGVFSDALVKGAIQRTNRTLRRLE